MQKNHKLFILSLVLINLFTWTTWCEIYFGFPSAIKYVLSLSSISIIVFYRFNSPTKPIPGVLINPFIILFIGWTVILLVTLMLNPYSPLWPGLSFLQRVFGQTFFFLPYFLPLIILYTKFDLDFLSRLFRFSFFLIIPAILLQLSVFFSGVSVGDKEQQSRIMIFDIGSSFLLLTAHLSRKKYILYTAILYTLLSVFLIAQWGRRAMLLNSTLVIMAMIIMRLRSLYLTFHDRIRIYFAGLLFIIVILYFGNIAASSYVFQRGFNQEAREETRGFLYEAFKIDFNKTSDWIFGRGIGGTILRSDRRGNYVDFIESGFLMLLFKGGLLYLFPFLVIMLRASYLGFYKSNNDLVKAMAALIIIYVISMYAWNWPEFTAKYVFLWISASVCFTPELRNASNKEIYQKINSPSET